MRKKHKASKDAQSTRAEKMPESALLRPLHCRLYRNPWDVSMHLSTTTCRTGGRVQQAHRLKNEGIKSLSNLSDLGEILLQYGPGCRFEGAAEFILMWINNLLHVCNTSTHVYRKKKHKNVVKTAVSFPKYDYMFTDVNSLKIFTSNLISNDMHIQKCNEYISYT